MYLVNERDLSEYISTDIVNHWLDRYSLATDEDLVCQRWLRQSSAKRYIFRQIYGDLLMKSGRVKVLDVGGGVTGLTRELATRHLYTLSDILSHYDMKSVLTIANQVKSEFIRAQDWLSLDTDSYDLVIANDIFPNVDQRLDIFLERFLPQTKAIRLSLTYYDTPRYYLARRIDAEEVLCMLAWNGADVRRVLEKYFESIVSADFRIFGNEGRSAFANGRQVVLVELKGSINSFGAV